MNEIIKNQLDRMVYCYLSSHVNLKYIDIYMKFFVHLHKQPYGFTENGFMENIQTKIFSKLFLNIHFDNLETSNIARITRFTIVFKNLNVESFQNILEGEMN